MAVSASSWTSFQGNNNNNGVTSEDITTTFATNWTSTTVASDFSGLDSGAIIDENDAVYCVSYSGIVYAFNLTTGSEIWNNSNIANNDPNVFSFELSVPAYHDNRLYIGLSEGNSSQNTTIYALNTMDGSVVWYNSSDTYFPPSHQLNSPIKYDPDSGNLYFGSVELDANYNTIGGYFYCVNASNGNVIWRYDSSTRGYYGAAPAIIGNYVVVGDDAGIVRSFNKEDGTLVDTLNTSTYGSIRSGIVYDDGSLYYSTTGGYLVTVEYDSSTGDIDATTLRSKDIGSRTTSTPAVTDDYIYVGTDSSSVKVIDKATFGNIFETYTVDGPVKASPVVTTNTTGIERVYVTTNNPGTCYGIIFNKSSETFTGNVSWQPNGSTYTLQGIAFANGYLVYGNDAGYLYGATGF